MDLGWSPSFCSPFWSCPHLSFGASTKRRPPNPAIFSRGAFASQRPPDQPRTLRPCARLLRPVPRATDVFPLVSHVSGDLYVVSRARAPGPPHLRFEDGPGVGARGVEDQLLRRGARSPRVDRLVYVTGLTADLLQTFL